MFVTQCTGFVLPVPKQPETDGPPGALAMYEIEYLESCPSHSPPNLCLTSGMFV